MKGRDGVLLEYCERKRRRPSSGLVSEDISSTLLQFLKRSAATLKGVMRLSSQTLATKLITNALSRSTKKTGQSIYLKNRFLQQNVLSSRKAQNLPQLHELSLSKILFPKSKPPSSAFQMTRKTPYELPLLLCFTELDFHHTGTSPKQN